MKPAFEGQAFVLGDDIDTDQIIPARHLVYSLEDPEERKNYGRFCLSGVPVEQSGLPEGHIPFVAQGEERSRFRIIIAGKNFGCGSSREHAPFALQMAGVLAVVAQSYARIFYRNAVDGGFVIPLETEAYLPAEIQTGDRVLIDLDERELRVLGRNKTFTLKPLGDVARIVEAGGIFEFARKTGMISGRPL